VSRVAVLGAGSFGTTLAILLTQGGHDVRLWGRDRTALALLDRERENRKFLAGIALPHGVKVHAELERALDGAEFVLFVVPSQALRSVAGQVAAIGTRGIPVCASKGLELRTLARLSEVLVACLGGGAPVTLTGPSHAEEVARGVPTTVVAACTDEARARDVQLLCSTPRFRVYTNSDVAGCEYGGALKNVIAIAAGVCDGLGFGDNTKGALLTRGLAEMARLGEHMGARRETFAGLTGMGDLIATAMSRHSRNRWVGERLGQGEPLDRILAGMVMVAEGVHTARAARDLGRQRGVELPITEQVCALFDGQDPSTALMALMTRDLKREA
jgi:glycerol-3-phosphate dehydrogenase (NAD(P)+)